MANRHEEEKRHEAADNRKDLIKLVSITDPQYSPDGAKSPTSKQSKRKQDSYDSHIMIYDRENKLRCNGRLGKAETSIPAGRRTANTLHLRPIARKPHKFT
ncbi:hypothetical protein PO124_07100 [Bacillus licheniformis]|nr:hypothetical protein [Bacillus licheniformis]